MTERVYYTSDATDGRAQIIACTAEADGRYAIELDRTLFHPQGGGQPADRLDCRAGVETVVVRGDSVLHILSQPLPLGEVEMKIDASARQLHARLHSAGHLLGLAGEQLGWQPVKAHHWPGEGRITFASRNSAALPDASALLALVKAWQAQDLPRQVTFADGMRKVGFGELPAYPCGGTHVARLAELGDIVISQIKMKKGQLVVSYPGVSVLSLLRIGLFAVINTLRSANLAVADFRFQKVVLHSLFQITASGGFAAAEDTGQRVGGMYHRRVGKQLEHALKGAFIDPAQWCAGGFRLFPGLNIKQRVDMDLAGLFAGAQRAAIAGKALQRVLQALIVHRLNQVIKHPKTQRFADGIHMIIRGNKDDPSLVMRTDRMADQIDTFAIG
jgi:Ser-tRNA(Ala) deacylase AlaX